jgi:ribonuclease HI
MKVFADGSTIRNGKENAKGGIGIFFGDNDSRNVSEKMTVNPTNQRCELLAILRALQILHSEQMTKDDIVLIYTDSQYSINCVTKWSAAWEKNNWQTQTKTDVKNQDILKPILELIRKLRFQLCFVHVRSHQPMPKHKDSEEYFVWYGNKMADELARLSTA